jgi:hypothetical protein
MLYKTLIAAFVVSSGDALRIDGLNTRRAAVTSAASALSLVPLAAFAELKKAGDADIYARADAGKLNAARVRTFVSTHWPNSPAHPHCLSPSLPLSLSLSC